MSAIILWQNWGFVTLIKGIISFTFLYIFKNKIIDLYNQFCVFLVKISKKMDKKSKVGKISNYSDQNINTSGVMPSN